MTLTIGENLTTVFQIFGGLALFLFGIHFLSRGFEKVAGARFQRMLEKLTNNPIKGAGVGAFATAVIQSSSLTMVTLIGLINAGLLNLRQAVGVMLGQEIGTTITAQIIAFDIGEFYFLMIGIGFVLYYFLRKRNYQYIGQIILGFGVLFLGMATMSSGLRPMSHNPLFIDSLRNLGQTPVLGIFTGAAFTAAIQSSSAMTGLVIAMGMENAISLKGAISLILGANIGTCITGLIASIGSSLSSRRAAVAQTLINIFGVAIFFPFLTSFADLISLTSTHLPRQIANAHTIFNVTVTLIMFPLIGSLVFIVKKILPGDETDFDRRPRFLDERILNTPLIALSQAAEEVKRIAGIVAEMLDRAEMAFINDDETSMKIIFEREAVVDDLCNAVEKYLDKISTDRLNKMGFRRSIVLIHMLTDIERIADHADNFGVATREKIKNKVVFSPQAKRELKYMFGEVRNMYEKAEDALIENNKQYAREVVRLEGEINGLEKKYRQRHIRRLERGICRPEADVIFTESLRNLERIGDHSDNIANSVLANL